MMYRGARARPAPVHDGMQSLLVMLRPERLIDDFHPSVLRGEYVRLIPWEAPPAAAQPRRCPSSNGRHWQAVWCGGESSLK